MGLVSHAWAVNVFINSQPSLRRSRREVGQEVVGFFSSVEDKYGLWIGCYASRPMSFMLSGSWEGAGGNGLDNERNGLLVGVRGPVDLLRKLVYWVHW
jgi:hypothetical protein